MRRTILIVLLILIIGAAAGLGWWLTHQTSEVRELLL